MGDMGDLFNDLKDIRRTRAQERVTEFQGKREAIEAAITALAEETRATVYFDVDPSGTFNVRLFSNRGPIRARGNGATIQYYPTKGTWQIKGKMHTRHSGPDAFLSWILSAMRKTL